MKNPFFNKQIEGDDNEYLKSYFISKLTLYKTIVYRDLNGIIMYGRIKAITESYVDVEVRVRENIYRTQLVRYSEIREVY